MIGDTFTDSGSSTPDSEQGFKIEDIKRMKKDNFLSEDWPMTFPGMSCLGCGLWSVENNLFDLDTVERNSEHLNKDITRETTPVDSRPWSASSIEFEPSDASDMPKNVSNTRPSSLPLLSSQSNTNMDCGEVTWGSIQSDSVTVAESTYGLGHCRRLSKSNGDLREAQSDATHGDDCTESLLKTPAGFYDKVSGSLLRLPALFDYSASGAFNSQQQMGLVESEWHIATERGRESRNTDVSSKMEECEVDDLSSFDSDSDFTSDESSPDDDLKSYDCVLSVLKNVLSDETTLSSDIIKTVLGSSASQRTSTPKHAAAKPYRNGFPKANDQGRTRSGRDSSFSLSAKTSSLNPLAPSFEVVPKQPAVVSVPVAMTAAGPAVVPVTFTRATFVPLPKSAGLRQVSSSNVVWRTPPMMMAYAPFCDSAAWSQHATSMNGFGPGGTLYHVPISALPVYPQWPFVQPPVYVVRRSDVPLMSRISATGKRSRSMGKTQVSPRHLRGTA